MLSDQFSTFSLFSTPSEEGRVKKPVGDRVKQVEMIIELIDETGSYFVVKKILKDMGTDEDVREGSVRT